MLPIILVAILVIIMVFYSISLHNKIIKRKNHRENTFADVDVFLKQRHDMIPQLVETVKGYMSHEADTLKEVTQARSRCLTAEGIPDKISSEMDLNKSMRGLHIAIEAYPDLKADENFKHLQRGIESMEEKIAVARTHFNRATRDYNNSIEIFPASSIASMYNFEQENMFDVGVDERSRLDTAPEIKF